MILINRKRELEWLNEIYTSKKAEFLVVYGRRRLGKTYLIKNFIKNKPHFYFLAKQRNIEKEFNRFKEKFAKEFNLYIEAKDFEEFFDEVLRKIKQKNKFIFVIDEFPYWIQKNPEIVSEFQYLWDEVLKNKNVFLVLIGSYVSIMENKLLSYKSPIYGRKTSQIELKRMPITALKEFFPKFDVESLINIYGLTDTIPYYLNMIESKDLKRNLLKLLNPNHNYFQDAEILLREEVREVATYLDILKAINEGKTKLNEIANASRVDITNISKYIKVLLGMKIIKKIKPLTFPEKEKNFVYKISDNYFRFWLSFIYDYKEEIEENLEGYVNYVLNKYKEYMGGVFEEFCIRFLPLLFNYLRIGRWWHKDREIDIVALNEKAKEIFFAECKWKDKVNAKKTVKELAEKSQYVQWHKDKRKESFIIFAKSFREKIKSYESKKVYCFDLKDLQNLLRKR